MAQPFEVPLSAAKGQTFGIQLGGILYNLTLVWNSVAACWMLTIADQNKVPLVSSQPVVTGLDLLAQFEYIGIPGSLIVQTDHDPDAVPTYENLGGDGKLYYVIDAGSASDRLNVNFVLDASLLSA